MADFVHSDKVSASNRVLDTPITITAGALRTVTGEPIAGSTTTEVIVPVDVSAVKGFYILATVACTLKTNSSGSPDETLALVANVPYVWHTSKYDAFKFEVDIVTMFFTVAGSTAGVVRMEILEDPTP